MNNHSYINYNIIFSLVNKNVEKGRGICYTDKVGILRQSSEIEALWLSKKIIISDIDGTLVINDGVTVLDSTIEQFDRLRREGHSIVLASGRPDFGLKHISSPLGFDTHGGYIISFNGCRITEVKSGKLLYGAYLEEGLLSEVQQFAKAQGIGIVTYGDECIIRGCEENEFMTLERTVCRCPSLLCEDFSRLGRVHKTIVSCEVERAAELEPLMQKLFGDRASVYRSDPHFVEVVPMGVNKATAIARLVEILGVSREDTICFGDSYNDIEMIEYAGIGIAMGNSCQPLKDVADYVTKFHTHHGIAYAIENFLKI